MKPANVAMLVVGIWMGVGGVAVGPGGRRGGWVGWGVAEAANAEAEGRKHARKANHLADVNKCKLAIPEYTKALRMLKDPTLLFNRGECYRRIGESTKAVADYRKFLVELPAAPNRAQVESQIAALDRSAAPPTAAAKAAAATATARTSVPPPAGKSAPTANAAVPTPEPSPPPPPAAPAARPIVEEPAREAPAIAEHEAPDLDEPRSLMRARAPAAREPAPTLIDSASKHPPAPAAESSSSHWWAWVVGAVVIGGGAAGTYFLLKQGKTEIPSSTLGNYKF